MPKYGAYLKAQIRQWEAEQEAELEIFSMCDELEKVGRETRDYLSPLATKSFDDTTEEDKKIKRRFSDICMGFNIISRNALRDPFGIKRQKLDDLFPLYLEEMKELRQEAKKHMEEKND